MSFKHGYPTIVKDGLVFYHDASNIQTEANGGGPSGATSYDLTADATAYHGLHGTFTNGAAILVDQTLRNGNLKSFRFDGSNDYIEFDTVYENATHGTRPTETQLNAKGFTCMASIKLSSIGSAHPIFVNDGIGQTTYQGLEFFVNASGYAGIMKGDGTGSSSSDRSTALSTTTLKDDVWYHVAWLLPNATKGNWKFTVNGIHTGTTTSGTGGSVDYSNNPAGLGRQRNANYLQGYIARVLCYDRLLRDDEILQDYHAHKIRFE